MGLDTYCLSHNELELARKEERALNELTYARKCWALTHFFENRSCEVEEGDDTLWNVPEEAWEAFYATFMPYYNVIRELESDDDSAISRYDTLCFLLERLLEDGDFQLGADWEARAILHWLDAYPEVKKVYDAGDDVYMVVSY